MYVVTAAVGAYHTLALSIFANSACSMEHGVISVVRVGLVSPSANNNSY